MHLKIYRLWYGDMAAILAGGGGGGGVGGRVKAATTPSSRETWRNFVSVISLAAASIKIPMIIAINGYCDS